MLKRFLAVAPAALLVFYGLWLGPRYDRYVLPAFDGYVYDAMADTPGIFTLAPWGYRVLAPRIVHLLPFPSAAEGFFWLTLASLSGAIFFVGLWMRRLGFGDVPSALAGLALLVAPPTQELLRYQVLVDPFALFVFIVTLVELTSPRVLMLTALFAVGGLTKEVCLVPLLVTPMFLVAKSGWKRGWIDTLIVAAPGLALAIYLRASWGEPRPALEASLLVLVIDRLGQSGGLLMRTGSLYGVGLAALLGFFRNTPTLLKTQGLALWLVTLGAIFLNPYHFSAPDLSRLSSFAWPALLPLALTGLGFRSTRTASPRPRFPQLASALAIATLLASLAVVLDTDPFRHEPEDAWANPVSYLARNREAIKTARFLEEGGRFEFDSRGGRFEGPITERFNLTEGRQHRWFLFDGFGPEAVYESGAPEFSGEARLLLPVMAPRPMDMTIDMEGPGDASVVLSMAGQNLTTIPAHARGATFRVPPSLLVRGDNLLRLQGPPGIAVRVIRFDVRVEGREGVP